MPNYKLELKQYVRMVAVVFTVSSATSFSLALVRIVKIDQFYVHQLDSSELGIHYFISGLMVFASVVGFINSCVVICRSAAKNTGRKITTWLLLDSLFETTRIVYLFTCEIVLKCRGYIHTYELLISMGQYLLDSTLYCQMILKH